MSLKNRNFKYILRFCIQPGFQEEEKLEELVLFCRKAIIDDVMFFINPEELNVGHITKSEAEKWIAVIERGKKRLTPFGVTVSVNPWTTLLGCDRGRQLKQGQNFQRMVDINGNIASAQACPLCPEFRKYIADMYAQFSTINPWMIWLEDDFRLHNHAPLKWGGCFCNIHMEEYSNAAGKKLSREEFINGVLKPGPPHPYRKIWLDTAKRGMVDLAKIIGQNVRRVSPHTLVGLMSSHPAVHCAEGRDWKGILENLASDNSMINRVHLPAYSEVTSQKYILDFVTTSLYTRALLPAKTEIFPELENFPYTRFSKSKGFTGYQLEISTVLGTGGITLNLYDLIGNGINKNEGYDTILRERKEFLAKIKRMGLHPSMMQGVIVPVCPEASYKIYTYNGSRIEELYPQETFWAAVFSAFGIPFSYSTFREYKNEVIAISGQYLRNLGKNEIEKLFIDNFVILEGEAAYTLYDMGLGELAGIKKAEWKEQDCGYISYEEVCNGHIYCGFKNARMSSQSSVGDYLKIKYFKGPEPFSVVKSPNGEVAGLGMILYKNKVFIMPYGRFKTGYMAHLNPVKRDILHSVLTGTALFSQRMFIRNGYYISLYCFCEKERMVMVIINSSEDNEEEIRLYSPEINVAQIHEVKKEYSRSESVRIWRDGDDIVIPGGLKHFEMRVFEVRYG